jgi:hypothetical protein
MNTDPSSSIAEQLQQLKCGTYPRYTHGHYVSTITHWCNSTHECGECKTVRDEYEYLQKEREAKLAHFNHDVLTNNYFNHSLMEEIRLMTAILRKLKKV